MNSTRIRIETFKAPSLQGNPLKTPEERPIHIYLPPGYFSPEKEDTRYPVLYFLHGYGGCIDNLVLIQKKEIKAHYEFLFRALLPKFFRKLFTLDDIDRKILSGELKPFILVQPDSSLPILDIFGKKEKNGKPAVKGSLYLNSPHTGQFEDYIFHDCVAYVDKNYRTLASKHHRAIIGASMGGFGALIGGINHADDFSAVAALSPGISWLNLLNRCATIPLMKIIYGKRRAALLGRQDVEDILDTADLVFSKDNPLLPTLQQRPDGTIVATNEAARQQWELFGLFHLMEAHPKSFHDVRLHISIHRDDEYGLTSDVLQFQAQLQAQGIDAAVNIYDDSFARRISPHMVGIITHVLDGIKFCLIGM